MKERRGALVGISPLINFTETKTLEMNKRLKELLVATVRKMQLSPNSISKIPGEVTLGIDIQSTSSKLKKEMTKSIHDFLEEIKRKRPLNIEIEKLVDDDPIRLDKAIRERLHETISKLCVSSSTLDSGAGHDVMNMEQK